MPVVGRMSWGLPIQSPIRSTPNINIMCGCGSVLLCVHDRGEGWDVQPSWHQSDNYQVWLLSKNSWLARAAYISSYCTEDNHPQHPIYPSSDNLVCSGLPICLHLVVGIASMMHLISCSGVRPQTHFQLSFRCGASKLCEVVDSDDFTCQVWSPLGILKHKNNNKKDKLNS